LKQKTVFLTQNTLKTAQKRAKTAFIVYFYETAGVVKVFVFVFAFVFSLLAFLLLLLLLLLSLVRVFWIHLGLLYALDLSRCELGA
jgi:hypothetical protein